MDSVYRTSDSGTATRLTASAEYVFGSNIGQPAVEGWLMTSGDAEAFLAEPGISDDLFNGRAWRGRNDIPCGYITFCETAGTTAIVVTVDAAAQCAFKANEPILICSSHEILNGREAATTTQYEWRMVTAVTTGGTQVSLTVASTSNTYYKGSVVIQPRIGRLRFTSESAGDDRYSLGGINNQLAAPDKPTVEAVSTTSAGFTVTVTKGTNKYFAKYADGYVFTSIAEALEGPSPNRPPDISNLDLSTADSATSSACKTYGGGASEGGGAMMPGSYYWLVVVLKETNSVHAKYRSKPSEPLAVQTL